MRGKLGAVILGGLLVASAPGLVGAQTRGSVSLGAGVNLPIGDFKDAAKLGWLGQVAGMITFGEGIFGVRVNGTYGQNNFKDEVGGGKIKMIGAMGDLVVSPRMEGNLAPYVLAGAGFVNAKNGESDTNFGWNAGAGVKAGSGKVGFYVEARFLSVRSEGHSTNMIPITAGVRISAGGN